MLPWYSCTGARGCDRGGMRVAHVLYSGVAAGNAGKRGAESEGAGTTHHWDLKLNPTLELHVHLEPLPAPRYRTAARWSVMLLADATVELNMRSTFISCTVHLIS